MSHHSDPAEWPTAFEAAQDLALYLDGQLREALASRDEMARALEAERRRAAKAHAQVQALMALIRTRCRAASAARQRALAEEAA